jgi:hypothetical protein
MFPYEFGEIDMPISEIVSATAAALPAVNTALSIAERLTKLVKGSANLEAQEAVMQLRQALLGVKEENLALKQVNLDLIEQLRILNNSAKMKSELQFEDPVYYRIQDNGEKIGPLCAYCLGNAEKQIPLSVDVQNAAWNCPVCKNYFETNAHRAATNAEIQRHNDSLADNW